MTTNAAIEAVFRIEWPRLVASISRITRDVGTAEELAQDALVTALETWPTDGIPDRPGAWLLHAAKNRAIDRVRHRKLAERKHEALDEPAAAIQPELHDIGDEMLRLVFVACHPVLSTDARVALTLRLLGGLEVPEIARAFLVPEATIQQRIVRAKKMLADANVGFEIPSRAEIPERLDAVLEVIYLIFNEGYAPTSGDAVSRPELCSEALRLARVVLGLVPDEPEAFGLHALLEIQASRLGARSTPTGEPILLADQDRARWDRAAIRRAIASIEQVTRLGGTRGFYALQAAIAACHAIAPSTSETDWARIAALYGALAQVAPSPIIEINRAVAVGMADGPEAGLAVIDRVAKDPALARYHLLPSVRGDLLAKLGRTAQAKREFERAADLAGNARERELLLARARGL